uniref:Sulfatase domain-containing protein n=1 Tax=Macrostomum lignano TaxID=282301 RepID=A0A1I8FPV4_9PLAT
PTSCCSLRLRQALKVQLNLNNTAKRSGKYFHCGDSSAAYVRQNADPARTPPAGCFEWRLTQSVKEVTDCFDMSGEFWFGGAEMWRQDWPLNTGADSLRAQRRLPATVRRAIERFWISTGGFAVFVEDSVPLYVSISGGRLCLSGSRSAEVYGNLAARNPGDPLLAYSVCSGADIKSLYRPPSSGGDPSETPERDLFERPVWSTWAYLKAGITQESVLSSRTNISAKCFAGLQLGVDDKWTVNYGDHVFDTARFPDPAAMARGHRPGLQPDALGAPFVNKDSGRSPREPKRKRQLPAHLKDALDEPAFTSWWRGRTSARAMYLMQELQRLKTDFGVDSFKLDAGEFNWLPENSRLRGFDNRSNPGWYANAWADFGIRLDPLRAAAPGEVVNISRRLLAIRRRRSGQRRPVPAGPFDLSGPGAGARRKIPQGALPQRPWRPWFAPEDGSQDIAGPQEKDVTMPLDSCSLLAG